MKLQSTLPERPGFLHVIPLFNLLALLFFLYSMGPMLMMQSGVSVEMAPTQFQLARVKQHQVVTLAGDGKQYWNREEVSLEALYGHFDRMLEGEHEGEDTMLLLRSDRAVSVEREREILEQALQRGIKVALVGKEQPLKTLRDER